MAKTEGKPISSEMKTICSDCKEQKCPNCPEMVVKGKGHTCDKVK